MWVVPRAGTGPFHQLLQRVARSENRLRVQQADQGSKEGEHGKWHPEVLWWDAMKNKG